MYDHANDPLFEGIDPELFKKSVTFLYMTRSNDIYHEFCTFLVRQAKIFERMGCALVQNSWRPAVEELFELGLECGSEFVHILDTDVGLQHDVAAKLMNRDLDIVASPLYFYDPAANDLHLNVHYDDRLAREYTPRMPEGGLEEIFATAFGSVMIKRRVLETFKQADESYCTWTDFIHEQFKDCSPDTIFFIKCQEFGFKVHMDWSIKIGTHHKYARFNTTLAEKIYVQRFFDVVFGPELKNKMFETPEGQNQLKTALQHHYASGLARRGAGSSDRTKPGPEGAPGTDSESEVRKDAGGVSAAVGIRATPPTINAGTDSEPDK